MRRVFLHYFFITVNAMFTRHACQQTYNYNNFVLCFVQCCCMLSPNLTCMWFEVTANKIAKNFQDVPEPCAKGTGNGKVKKHANLWHRWKNSIDGNLDAGWLRRFARARVLTSWNAGCFLRLEIPGVWVSGDLRTIIYFNSQTRKVLVALNPAIATHSTPQGKKKVYHLMWGQN